MVANIVIVVALLTVLVTLVLGMINMLKTGEEARLKSNQLMRVRVTAQAIAVAALFLMLYLKSQGSA